MSRLVALRYSSRIAGLLFLIGLVATSPAKAATPVVEWIRQFGTPAADVSAGIATNGPNDIYVSASTNGNLGGPTAGNQDIVLSKFDPTGTQQWIKQFGTPESESTERISIDGSQNVYISGTTRGNLGGPNAGGLDSFFSKLDSSGTLIATRQFGTSADEEAYTASADSTGNVYVSGYTRGPLAGANHGGQDGYVRKYDSAGTVQWTRQFGTSSDDMNTFVSADNLGNVFVAGMTFGSLDGPNAGSLDDFIRKYDTSGNLIWAKQFGTSAIESILGVTNDGVGNVYITGQSFGNLAGPGAGSSDAFVAKYNSSGTQQWIRQFGSAGIDIPENLFVDSTGSVFVTGLTKGNLQGVNAGGNDIFVSKLDALGNVSWTQQLGTSADDAGADISADGLGHVYVSGYTYGSLGGPLAGDSDAFVLKISEVPEPHALVLALIAALGLISRRPGRGFQYH
jgi:hypothetical protein